MSVLIVDSRCKIALNCHKSLTITNYYKPVGPVLVLLEAIKAVSLSFSFFSNKSIALNTADSELEMIRNGIADISSPDFAARLDRLNELTLVTVPVYSDYTGFIVNHKLIQGSTFIKWPAVFEVWFLVVLWRVFLILIPNAKPDTNHPSLSFLLIHVQAFSFFVKLLFGKMLLTATVSPVKFPFLSVK